MAAICSDYGQFVRLRAQAGLNSKLLNYIGADQALDDLHSATSEQPWGPVLNPFPNLRLLAAPQIDLHAAPGTAPRRAALLHAQCPDVGLVGLGAWTPAPRPCVLGTRLRYRLPGRMSRNARACASDFDSGR